MKKKIYISGAISHKDLNERQQAFKNAEASLNFLGFEAVNPFNNQVGQDKHWSVHMKEDLKNLLCCDAIYLLEGWEESKGAKLEMDVASSCGLRVFYNESIDTLLKYVKGE